MSFERARRADSNDIKISFGTQFWAEIQVPESRKTIGGSKLIFGVKNSNMQMIAHSKELVELSRMYQNQRDLTILDKVMTKNS